MSLSVGRAMSHWFDSTFFKGRTTAGRKTSESDFSIPVVCQNDLSPLPLAGNPKVPKALKLKKMRADPCSSKKPEFLTRRPTLTHTSKNMLLRHLAISLVLLSGLLAEIPLVSPAASAEPRQRILLHKDWKFHLGPSKNGQNATLDDSAWRTLDLPHDWSLEDLPGQDHPIREDAINSLYTGFTVGGTGWYRKSFTLPATLKDRRVAIEFEGVYHMADVWINGHHLGHQPFGYTTFRHDLTSRLRWDQPNIIAVEVKNEGKHTRWYSGSGIYRHVWLDVTGPVSIAPWGVAITTPPGDQGKHWINTAVTVENHDKKDRELKIVTRIVDTKGVERATAENTLSVAAGRSATTQIFPKLENADLWSPDSPTLYQAITTVLDGETTFDSITTPFGIRSFQFTADRGFLLNGKPMLLKGGNLHHDNGPLGAVAYDRAEERRVELMKANGFNAIRCAHNPPSPAFLRACDRLGMLVINEAFDAWRIGKNPDDYNVHFDQWWKHDLESMIRRDRNHPSIILWSTGNEIPERGTPEGVRTSAMLAAFVHEQDPSRPVTAAIHGINPKMDPAFATLDVAGYNYGVKHYVPDHKRHPKRVMYGSESNPIRAFEYWMAVVDHPWVVGDFVWTGFDYLGEASIGWLGLTDLEGHYPWLHAYCGDLDICGFKRPQSHYRDVLWNESPQLSIFVKPPVPTFPPRSPDLEPWDIWQWDDVLDNWNWQGHEGKPLDVSVYSNNDRVELLLNGKSLGSKETHRAAEFKATWQVPYEAGELIAVAYRDDREVARSSLKTTGKPAAIRLSADRGEIHADNQDLAFITVEIIDENGLRVPAADHLVEFQINGAGVLAAVGSANPIGTESFRLPKRKAWQGRCLAIIKSTDKPGSITLTVQSENLTPAAIEVQSASK